MKQLFQKIPFLRISLDFAAGIVMASLLAMPTFAAVILLISSLIALILLHHFYSFRSLRWFGALVHVFFIFLGISLYTLYNKKPTFFKAESYSAVVLETPVEKTNSYQSLLNIKTVISQDSAYQTDEKVVAFFTKNGDAAKLQPGDILILKQEPQPIKNKGNPFEFDYKTFLARDRIYRQVYLSEEKWKKTDLHSSFSFRILAEKTRIKMLGIYRSQDFSKNELDILSALTMGYKRELDQETKRVFSSAGAMHVLAVSGLHVGIVFFILRFFFGFLKRKKTGRILFVVISITVLWAFAFITGLSPSVSRAATMFTFLVIGNNLNRQTSIYNTLAGSAFFLLLVNPNNLFDVGFQLSYSAVFGIVFLQPKMENLASPSYKIPLYFWRLLTVSVAAQIATLPITLFYFNQFPAYFWISNLFVIPAAFALIPLGFALLLLHSIPLLSTALFKLTALIIDTLYSLLQWIENLPGSVWKIQVSPAELVFLLGFLFTVFVFIEFRRKSMLKSLLLFILLFLAASLYSKTTTLFNKQIIIYNSNENMILHLISGRQNYIVSQAPMSVNDYSYDMAQKVVKALRLEKPVMLTTSRKYEDEILVNEPGMLLFENKMILINADISALPKNIAPDLIVNPQRINNITLNDSVSFCIVTNSRYNPEGLKSPHLIHNLREKGAFITKW